MTHCRFSLQSWRISSLLLAALSAMLLAAGCGGGGGGGNGSTTIGGTTGNNGTTGNTGGTQPTDASVIGKISDASGNPIPGATIIPDNGGAIATSLSQGSYRIDGLTPGVHRLTAAVTYQGQNYTGSTEVLTQSQAVVSNASIEVSPANQQTTITGTVTDASNNPINGARVFAGVPSGSGIASLVAFTDPNGVFSLSNIPTSLTSNGGALPIAASVLGYENARTTVTTLQPGVARTVGFQLAASSGGAVPPPTNLALQAFTQPGTSETASASRRAQSAQTGSVYETLRRLLSPAYARSAQNRHAAAHRKSLIVHPRDSVFGQFAVEIDLSFDIPVSNVSNNVSGFTIYRTLGLTQPVQTPSEAYDFLQDPLANFYSDLDPSYIPNQQANFAVSATNSDQVEGTLSNSVASVVPLNLLTITQPQVGQSLPNPATIYWNPIQNVTGYYVFIYDHFPSVDSQTVFPTSQINPFPLPAGSGGYTLPTLPISNPAGQDYYVVVAGVNNTPVVVDGIRSNSSAVTFSQITRFHIQ